MNDPKPMRLEDELALQAENGRLRTENERLRARDLVSKKERLWSRHTRWKKALGLSLKVVGTSVALVSFFVVVGHVLTSCRAPSPATAAQPVHTNPNPCYFVRQGYETNVTVRPWEPWYVFRSSKFLGGSGADVGMWDRSNSLVFLSNDVYSHLPVHGSTREEAWRFIVKWNLPACK